MYITITSQEFLAASDMVVDVAQSLPKRLREELSKLIEKHNISVDAYKTAIYNEDVAYFEKINDEMNVDSDTTLVDMYFAPNGDIQFDLDSSYIPELCGIIKEESGVLIGLAITAFGLLTTIGHGFKRIGDRVDRLIKSYEVKNS